MYQYNATVVRIVDGDTLEMEVDCGFRLSFRDRFRLNGINCPERNTDAGKAACFDVLKYLGGNLPVGVRVTTTKPDKYGRWLADVQVPGQVSTLNQFLVQCGAAKPWDGKGERP